MDQTPWKPWKELEQVEREVDQLLDAVYTKLAGAVGRRDVAFVPAIDVVETEQEFRLYVATPGVLEDDIDISVRDRTVTIRGERESPPSPGKTRVRQWRYGYFERRVELPSPVDADRVEATLEGGVLTIVAPKLHQD